MNVKPIGLASAFTVALIALYCRADNAFVGYFAITGSVEVLLAGFATGALASSILLAFIRPSSVRRIVAIVIWTLASLLGIFAAWMGTNADPSVCAVIGGALLGVGSVGMLGQWARCFGRFPREAVLATVACSLLLMSFIWFALRLMSGFLSLCMAMALCATIAGVVAIVESISTRDRERAQRELDSEGEKRNRLEVRAALTSFESFVFDGSSHASRWHAMEAGCALVLGFFVTGAAFWPNATEVDLPSAFIKPASYLIACIAVLVVGRFATSISYTGHDERQPMRVVLIVAALIFVAGACISAVMGDSMRSWVRMFNYVGFALLAVYGISYIYLDLTNSGISSVRACVIAVCLCYIGMALGILAYLLLGAAVSYAVALVAIAYAGLVLVIAVQAEHGGRTSKDYRRNR